ncbi:C-type lectin domain family 7 member A-like isoform X2 [Talpa occidentalis]|uniref:C-type lectin domain family 7 member A-like isoform X2 n=1 Tax=Talpa occidentalis TaxID=50954 RepID=UPI00188F7A3D|nr:C-type lectin domain family 7 member A-like isoform X2 [Talpa occidentalis]
MSEVVYSDVRLQHPSQPQRRQGLQKPEKKFLSDFRCEDFPAHPSWKFIAVILGICCMVLLLSVGLLTARLNQNSFKVGRFTGNETAWIYPTCPFDWHQRGENCYFFSREKNQWIECERLCSRLESRFLKMDTEDEVDFVINVSKMYPGEQQKFFIGLYYNRKLQTWIWYDNTNLDLNRTGQDL